MSFNRNILHTSVMFLFEHYAQCVIQNLDILQTRI